MEKEIIDRDRSDAEWVTSTEQGRRFMWRLLSHCGVYRDIEGHSEDVFKQIGRRQVGLYLLGLISDASEDRIFEMMKEAKNRSIEEKIKYDNANRNTDNKHINTSTRGELPTFDASGIDGLF